MIKFYTQQQLSHDDCDAGYRNDDDIGRPTNNFNPPEYDVSRDLEKDRTPFKPTHDMFEYIKEGNPLGGYAEGQEDGAGGVELGEKIIDPNNQSF